jgi:phage terminase large subunit-like protein
VSIDRHGLPFDPPDGCWFDAAAADAAAAFFPKYLRHTEGRWAGQPFNLAAWQAERAIRPAYGWKRADGLRLIRSVYLEVPRKNGKTELCAGVSLLCLIGDGEFGGQGYAAAVEKDQARLVFDKASRMASMSEDLSRHLELLKTSIYCPELMASFKPLSSRPDSKHGFSPSFSIADEIHAWANGELAQVIRDGMGARAQPLSLEITTAGIKGWGYGWEVHDRAMKVLDGTLYDPSFLPVVFAADPDDDWTDERVWAKANPNLGVSPRLDFLREQCLRARESARLENNFRRYHLNQWTEQVSRWLAIAAWDESAGPASWRELEERLAGRRCFAAVDLSSKIDVTALVLVFPPAEPDGAWYVLPRFFLPAEDLEARIRRDRLPYDRWAAEGALTLTPGNVVDYGWIEERLRQDGRRFRIEECAYDAWNATQFATRMQDEGLAMIEFGQGFRSMSEPAKELERLVLQRRWCHGRHPVLREMAKAVSVVSDPAGNIKPDKGAATLRIDGIVAAIMALGRAMVDGSPVPYADGRSLLVI